jgi:hypothetical protein
MHDQRRSESDVETSSVRNPNDREVVFPLKRPRPSPQIDSNRLTGVSRRFRKVIIVIITIVIMSSSRHASSHEFESGESGRGGRVVGPGRADEARSQDA